MKIGNRDSEENVMIIAEVGNNHEGNLNVAKELVVEAANAGVDAVKFQTFRTELFANPGDAFRYERMKKFELTTDAFRELHALAKSLDLLFISTPLDLESAEFLSDLVDCFKVASGDNNFYPLLDIVADSEKPVIISSGVSDLEQIAKSKQHVEARWARSGVRSQLAVLHCVSNYPVAPSDAQLAAIPVLAESLQCEIGYSDHTIGVDACLLSVALGARIVEKHFTLDKNYSDFRDHQLSVDPAEMATLVDGVRNASLLLGDSRKQVLESETEILPLLRRSIVAKRSLPKGHQITRDDLMWIRPADGLAPGNEQQLLGHELNRSVEFAQPIRLADVA